MRSPWLAAAILALGVFTRAAVQSYVIVIDGDRRPVLGLSAEDFSLRDGGVKQSVDDVVPATAPLAIAVVVDGFEAADRAQLTSAIAGATARLAAASPRHRINLLDAPGRSLTDAIVDASRTLQDAETDRRAVIAIIKRRAGDGAVSSTSSLTSALVDDRVSLWTIEVGPAQNTALDRVLTDATAAGGALRELVPATAGMPDAAVRVIHLLTSQYVVTYQWPNPMLSLVNISIRHERGTVLATSWMR